MMSIALKEKKTKRAIKDKMKEILDTHKEDLNIVDVAVIEDDNYQPKFPCLALHFFDSQSTEGNIAHKKVWSMRVGVSCLIRENNREKARRQAEETVGIAADYLIDNLPISVKEVHEVNISMSSEGYDISVDNKMVVGNAIFLEVLYII